MVGFILNVFPHNISNLMCLLLVISILYLPFNCHYPHVPRFVVCFICFTFFQFNEIKIENQKTKTSQMGNGQKV